MIPTTNRLLQPPNLRENANILGRSVNDLSQQFYCIRGFDLFENRIWEEVRLCLPPREFDTGRRTTSLVAKTFDYGRVRNSLVGYNVSRPFLLINAVKPFLPGSHSTNGAAEAVLLVHVFDILMQIQRTVP